MAIYDGDGKGRKWVWAFLPNLCKEREEEKEDTKERFLSHQALSTKNEEEEEEEEEEEGLALF